MPQDVVSQLKRDLADGVPGAIRAALRYCVMAFVHHVVIVTCSMKSKTGYAGAKEALMMLRLETLDMWQSGELSSEDKQRIEYYETSPLVPFTLHCLRNHMLCAVLHIICCS